MSLTGVRALVFDVFGTVVDWRSSVIREASALGARHHVDADWEKLADAWRAAYAPAMNRVRSGELPWTKLDALHRSALDTLLDSMKITGLGEEARRQLNLAWHRLQPWPDSVAGLERLRRKYLLATLSNGNVSLLAEMGKNARLPWDCILSAELFRHYKPDREVYLGAAELLSCQPSEVLMVAAHANDLVAARGCGLRTAYVARPHEHGPAGPRERVTDGDFDLHATDLLHLASLLGA